MESKRSRSILFLCTGNACRSQIAEGFARSMLPQGWRVYSAGVAAAGLHARTIDVMMEVGIDISGQHSKTLDEVPVDEIDYVITLCGHARDLCPVFPRAVASEHWPIDDPMHAADTHVELQAFRRARDDIRRRVEDLVKRLKG